MRVSRRSLLGVAAALPATGVRAQAGADWAATLAAARGQSVRFNAWGGDDRTNAFIAWAGEQVGRRFGVTVTHVRLRDTADAVQRVIAERGAGRTTEGGSVDLLWVNGPNLANLKGQSLLFGPFADRLPSFALVDQQGKPATVVDFTLPVEGLAAPWLMAQFVYVYDSARMPNPARTLPEMLAQATARPGRIVHPHARNFTGATFLKQALVSLASDQSVFTRPVETAPYEAAARPLWEWYRALRPHLWRRGATFPLDAPQAHQLLGDGEADLTCSFNPADASGQIAAGRLPASVRTMVLTGGTIGNASFVAIPINATAKAGAMVLAEFLLSPEAQAHAADERVLGQPTVLDIARLSAADRARFDALPRGIATLPPAALSPSLPEPHPTWMTKVTEDWLRLVQG
ncbi:MAG: ABC transporter substrate-binding protein [Alphaproteobacteria bacterium]|nr:MAG: ABC transporter substrate-binding protein [Alphaproteobacteria bacterium]